MKAHKQSDIGPAARRQFVFLAILLAGLLGGATHGIADKKVYLKFSPFVRADIPGGEGEFIMRGGPSGFNASKLIEELTARENAGKPADQRMTTAQIGDMVMDGIVARLKEVYKEVWIDFTKVAPTEGMFVTLDFPGKVSSAAFVGDIGDFAGKAPLDEGDKKWDEKAWVLPEEYRHFFWFFTPDGEGDYTQGTDRRLTKAEITLGIAHTAAHELGHTLGLDHPAPDNHTFTPPADETDNLPDGVKSKIVGVVDPTEGHIMSSGQKIYPSTFSAGDLRALKATLGERQAGEDGEFYTEDDVAVHKPARTERKGDGDDHGTNPDRERKEGVNGLHRSLIEPGEVTADGDDPFTDTILTDGLFNYQFDLGGPLGFDGDVLLTIGLFNIDPNAAPVGLAVDGMPVPNAFQGIDLTAGHADTSTADFGAFFAHHLFLNDVFDQLTLEGILGDGFVGVTLAVPPDQAISIDYMVLRVQIPDSGIDSDGDGLSDDTEVAIYGTLPDNPDTDGDGLTDGEEVKVHGTAPDNPDSDGDNLLDSEEIGIFLTNPLAGDTDGDGLNDEEELFLLETDPNSPDTDGDELTDGEEVNLFGTDPFSPDSEGDGYGDAQELVAGTDPNDPAGPYPTVYRQNFEGFEDGAIRFVDGSRLESGPETNAEVVHGALRLTEEGLAGQRAVFRLPPLFGASQGWCAYFDVVLRSQGPPAHGGSFAWGSLPPSGLGPVDIEEGWGTLGGPFDEHIDYNIDTWMNGDPPSQGLDIVNESSGSGASEVAGIDGPIFQNPGAVAGAVLVTWRPVGLQSTTDYQTIGFDTNAAFSAVGSVVQGDDGFTWAIGARTGSAHQDFIIDNLCVIAGNNCDTDTDGLPDPWEIAVIGDLVFGPGDDPDNDGKTNQEELAAVTNPLLADTDRDGLDDGDECDGLLNPYDSNGNLVGAGNGGASTAPNIADSDADGIDDGEEVVPGEDGEITDPNRSDTDGDGSSDPTEIAVGSDPTDPGSVPEFRILVLAYDPQLGGVTISLDKVPPFADFHFRGSGDGENFDPVVPPIDIDFLTPGPVLIPIDPLLDPVQLFRAFPGTNPQ